MKTEIINKETQTEWKFPCLGKHVHSELVVLFRSNGMGTVLMHATSNDEIGKNYVDWVMKSFTPLTGEVTIKFTK